MFSFQGKSRIITKTWDLTEPPASLVDMTLPQPVRPDHRAARFASVASKVCSSSDALIAEYADQRERHYIEREVSCPVLGQGN